ncbi:MAG TPA: histidine phosphatase family protein [Cyclobacteriaceae bacterium]
MKHLYIVRHAKSSWDDLSLQDAQRPLSERGRRDAPRMAKRFKEREVAVGQMISSPAVRAMETCKVFASILGYPEKDIRIERSLYHASEDGMLEVVRGLSDTLDNIMIFGHNPGLTDFVNSLTSQTITNVPTCGIAGLTFPVDRWQDVTWGMGTLEYYDYPKSKERK